MSSSEVYATFEGIDRGGVAAHGATPEEVGPFVARRWRAGWRSLTVTRHGEYVGGIVTLEGDRIWWAENAR